MGVKEQQETGDSAHCQRDSGDFFQKFSASK